GARERGRPGDPGRARFRGAPSRPRHPRRDHGAVGTAHGQGPQHDRGPAARAFADGADAVYAMPYHAAAPGLGGLWFMIAFNHAFCVPTALSEALGLL